MILHQLKSGKIYIYDVVLDPNRCRNYKIIELAKQGLNPIFTATTRGFKTLEADFSLKMENLNEHYPYLGWYHEFKIDENRSNCQHMLRLYQQTTDILPIRRVEKTTLSGEMNFDYYAIQRLYEPISQKGDLEMKGIVKIPESLVSLEWIHQALLQGDLYDCLSSEYADQILPLFEATLKGNNPIGTFQMDSSFYQLVTSSKDWNSTQDPYFEQLRIVDAHLQESTKVLEKIMNRPNYLL